MKIPFDIKYRPQIESGEYKVVTRKGETVRIERWDGKDGANPIDAFIWHNGEWNGPWHWHNNGLYKTAKSEDDFDLFIITPKLELTELEQYIENLTLNRPLDLDDPDFYYNCIKDTAKIILKVARKEICKGCTVSIDNYIKGREDGRKEAEKSYTFHYPTYQPPCFHGGVCTNPFMDCINCPRQSSDYTHSTTSGTCKKD